MNTRELSPAELEFLQACCSDYTPLVAAFDTASRHAKPASFLEKRDLTTALLVKLTGLELVRPGRWNANVDGLDAWPGGTSELSDRIVEHLGQLDEEPTLVDPMWFVSTETGENLIRDQTPGAIGRQD